MSRSRMWGNDAPPPEVPSPRTTIVGGRPPDEGAELPPVPTGIQQLLRLASVDEAFRLELLERRGELAEAAGVTLTPSERLVLGAVPASQIAAMIDGLPPPAEDRRTFLRQTASTAVLLLGGAALAVTEASCIRGSSADVPAAPPPKGPALTAGARPEPPPEPPRPESRESATTGGAAPDVPEPRPDAGPPRRPRRRPPSKGIRPGVPRGQGDDED